MRLAEFLWFAEFSPSQNAFNVCPAADCLAYNMRVASGEKQTDYIPIAIFESQAECSRFIQQFRKDTGIGG